MGTRQEDMAPLKNDIWTSADNGTNWTQISIPSDRHVGQDDKVIKVLFMTISYGYSEERIGGANGTDSNNDIWTSADGGINWSQISVNGNQWSKRQRFHQSFSYDDKLWVLGGTDSGNNYKK